MPNGAGGYQCVYLGKYNSEESRAEYERVLTERRLGATAPMRSVLRTWTLPEPRGFMKALIEKGGDRILGFTAFGVEAGEVMAVVQLAMTAGLPYTALRDAVVTHPTMAEGLVVLFSAVPE